MHALATLFRLLIGGGLTVVVFAQTGASLVGLLVVALLLVVVFTPGRRSAVS
jgi:hypothetical protein